MTKRLNPFKLILFLTALAILAPVFLILLWAFTERWSWPNLWPEHYTLKAINEIFGAHSKVFNILLSSIILSAAAGTISTVLAFLAARAFALYEFCGKAALRILSMMPLVIPANVFAMGIHVNFIRWGLNDSVTGVLICHVIYSLPYSVSILADVMSGTGAKYEEQANVLGCAAGKAVLNITLPLTLTALIYSVVIAYIISFSQYFLTLLIGGGRVKTFSVIMVPFIQSGDKTVAGAYVILFLLSSLIVFFMFEGIAGALRGKYEVKS